MIKVKYSPVIEYMDLHFDMSHMSLYGYTRHIEELFNLEDANAFYIADKNACWVFRFKQPRDETLFLLKHSDWLYI